SCYFLAIDFDGADWKDDARSFAQSCIELNIPVSIEISRSGNGAHAWIYFADSVPARLARQLGSALLSFTCDRNRMLSLSSYDRFFPNQDTLPKGGFGNLIALPLQKKSRDKGCRVFVDEEFVPYPDQWNYLASIRYMQESDLKNAIMSASRNRHPLDLQYLSDDEKKPWESPLPDSKQIPGVLPKSINLVLANQIFIDKSGLSPTLTNRIIRLAAFQNPEFYKAQAMRLPVWNKPRIIACAENYPEYISLPRGCFDSLREMLQKNRIGAEIKDERTSGNQIAIKFLGRLHKEQKMAMSEMLRNEIGVLCAPTAFGKTITAAAIIARRKVNTLILVHRSQLLRQWQERLNNFLKIKQDDLGVMGGGKAKLTGKIDIAVMQSLSRRNDLFELINKYGQIIVDECHHISAFSFEKIVKQAKAKYVIGLTATPIRRDGHHPIIYMQCGPIRHIAGKSEKIPLQLEVCPLKIHSSGLSPDMDIQEVFHELIHNQNRNRRIAQDILTSYRNGRKIIVLTGRIAHLGLLRKFLGDEIENCFILHGRISRKYSRQIFEKLDELSNSAPRVILATGSLIGEGFDHPPLDTLVLAMPVSWKGTLQQYAGRLHRNYRNKKVVRIYDYIDYNEPRLIRMWNKRKRGYRAMGYQLQSVDDEFF
ncbi:MAG: DEAD/DEAH box helicase, partial [Calditrichaeota bacterium]